MPKSTPKAGAPVRIDRLHPTQLTLGFTEVEERLARYRKLGGKARAALAVEKAVPHVLGPAGTLYMVDHHHFCRVLHSAGEETAILGERRADLSGLEIDAFWIEMAARDLCWPIDRYGCRRPCRLIPGHVGELADNPWRSFARSVRGQAFRDEDRPFQEFRWGEYFRGFMTERLIAEHEAIAQALACRLARLDQARDLPGWRGEID